jgi:arginyl-tRNA synthetase
MIRDKIIAELEAALQETAQAQGIEQMPSSEIELTDPPKPEMGDFSTNAALVAAKRAQLAPRELARLVAERLQKSDLPLARVEIAGPGFINMFMSDSWLPDTVAEILVKGEQYGRSEEGAGSKVQVEFVSANPVGPIHIGNARGAPFGDALASMLDAIGYEVEREYYVNDGPHNTQALNFGRSLQARYLEALGREVEFPEDGYQGEYVIAMGRQLAQKHGEQYADMALDGEAAYVFFRLLEEEILEEAEEDLRDFGVEFDCWFTEKSLYDNGDIERELVALKEKGMAYESEGATWLRTAEFGDEKDRVLVRSDGRPTYIAADAAYAANKFARGFDRLIYVLGPDHAGYVPRLQAVLAACGFDLDRVEIIVYQNVRMIRGGETVKLAKRKGQIYSVRDLIDEVGTDAARFFFLMRSNDSHLDFDLDLAASKSEENPVYYVQYAHARICSIAKMAETREFQFDDSANLALLTDASETALMRKLADYPHELESAAELRAPHRLTTYLRELTQLFHQFYTNCQVLNPEDIATSTARMALTNATRQVLGNCLGILGITAPESM